MANARIGSHTSHGYCVVQTLDTTKKQLGSGDSGKVFMCVGNASNAVEVYLPQLSLGITGWQAKFIIKTAGAEAFNIIAFGSSSSGSTAGDSDTIICMEEADTNVVTTASDYINFAGGQYGAGEYCNIFTDGSNWYASFSAIGDSVGGGLG